MAKCKVTNFCIVHPNNVITVAYYCNLSVRGGTLVNVTGSSMDSVDSPSINLTVVLTQYKDGGIVFTDNGTTNYEVKNCVECSHNPSVGVSP
jgi:hypothetical protein